MKKLFALLVLALLSTPALAETVKVNKTPHDDDGDADEQHQPCLPGLNDSFFFHDCCPFSFWLDQIEKG